MATQLTPAQKDQLSKWIDSTKNHKFTLLYKISRDGCSNQTFHNLCDNKGPTVTVLYNTNKSVYGGYTAVNWQSNGAYSNDANAFLFKLEFNGTAQPMKFPNKTGGKNAIYRNASYGPTFGSGNDLRSFSGTIKKSGKYFPLNGTTNGFGTTYDVKGQNYNSVMNGHLQVLDLEVYSIEEMATELTPAHKDQLSKWIDSTKIHKFTLLYKISRDGCSNQTFHNLCDNKGPTVTVLYNTNKSVYGGYTAVNWQSNGAYSNDAKAFLFELEFNGTAQPTEFPNKTGGTNAIYGHASYGPTFGSGNDLCCFSGTINKYGNYFPLNGTTNGFGTTYDVKGQNYNSVMNGHLQVLELEVYSIEEMATELTPAHKDQLSKWIDSSKNHKFTLLYKISRDGCSNQTFHNLCDNKGPTVTVLYNTNKSVYGGYTSVNWQSNGAYSTDAKAFLFKLEFNGTAQPMKFPNKTGGTNAIFGHESYGPTFGGDDLHSFSGTVNKSRNIFPLNGNTDGFGTTYDVQGQNYNSVTNGHLQVLDLEVYSIEEPGTLWEEEEEEEQELLQKPWIRNVDWSRKFEEEVKDKVATYKPLPGLDLQQARILLVGQVGAGKSSYFNTINSIFRGHISAQANAGSAEHSLTTDYRIYSVRDGYAGKPLNFRLCDTRGLEEDQGLDDHEIGYLLEGHVPDKHKFNPAVPLSPDAIGFVKNPTVSDKIHCVAFVLDGSTVDVIPEKVMERIKAIQLRINQRNIPQVVLLTKIDRVCEEVSNDISKVFFSPRIKKCVDRVAMVMGLPRSHILPLKNYECEVELDQNTNILSLLSLRRILNFADDYLYNTLDDIEPNKMQQMKIRE